MKTVALTAALAAFAAMPAMADTMTKTTTYDTTTYGVIEGDGLEAASVRETTTVTSAANSASVATNTSVDTADYDKYYTDSGEPKYLGSYAFSLE